MKVVVFIPIYNAFEESLRCLKSVLLHSPKDQEIVIVDDASTEGKFKTFMDERNIKDTRITLKRNVKNLGFVETCNFGMNLFQDKDIVLLNSDTIVTAGWLEKMKAAAYSNSKVGTVTTLTNNGNQASFPKFSLKMEDNEIFGKIDIDYLAQVVEKVSTKEYPILPTCIAHCVYIKREVIEKIGVFDAETFGRGYGEENDFSLRAEEAGFTNILDDATFIYHKGESSFKENQKKLHKENIEIIKKRYPHYLDRVSKFYRRGILRPVRLRILDELVRLENKDKRRVLHVLHNGPFESHGDALGGVEYHVQNLINEVKDLSHWSLVVKKDVYLLTCHMKIEDRTYIFDRSKTNLEDLISRDKFETLHIHHTRHFNIKELGNAISKHANYFLSIHDYVVACPKFFLLKPNLEICSGKECVSACNFNREFIQDYRAIGEKIITQANKVFVFSQKSSEYLKMLFPMSSFNQHLISHPSKIHKLSSVNEISQNPKKPFKILFLGDFASHKGLGEMKALTKISKLASDPLEWHLLGKIHGEKISNLILHGSYNYKDLSEKIEAIDPHILLVLSKAPETYGLTLDEALACGVPAIVPPYGAHAERVENGKVGWVLNNLRIESIKEKITHILNNWNEYEAIKKNVLGFKLPDGEKIYEFYKRSYIDNSHSLNFTNLHNFTKEKTLPNMPEPKLTTKFISKASNLLIYLLDTLKVRFFVQRLAYKYMPASILDKMKAHR